MQRFRWISAVVLAVAALVAIGPATTAQACSCIVSSDAELLERADVVFSGFVSASTDPSSGASFVSSVSPLVWTFEVEQVSKGTISSPLDVSSARSSASCGVDFVVGERYEVYALERNGSLSTGLCSGTRALPTPAPAESWP